MKILVLAFIVVSGFAQISIAKGKVKLKDSPSGRTKWCAFTSEPSLEAHDAYCSYETQMECAKDVIDIKRSDPDMFSGTTCESKINLEKWYDVW